MLGNSYPGSPSVDGENGSCSWTGGKGAERWLGKGGNSKVQGEYRPSSLTLPAAPSVSLVIMARWKDLWGPGLGRRKFANFHDRARIISGWLGGFRTWQMTAVSGYRLHRRLLLHSELARMSAGLREGRDSFLLHLRPPLSSTTLRDSFLCLMSFLLRTSETMSRFWFRVNKIAGERKFEIIYVIIIRKLSIYQN